MRKHLYSQPLRHSHPRSVHPSPHTCSMALFAIAMSPAPSPLFPCFSFTEGFFVNVSQFVTNRFFNFSFCLSMAYSFACKTCVFETFYTYNMHPFIKYDTGCLEIYMNSKCAIIMIQGPQLS